MAWSDQPELTYPSLAYERDLLTTRSVTSVTCVALHTTGYGVVKRYRDNQQKFKSPFHAALHVYGRITKFSPHIVVGQCGSIGYVTPFDKVAWHVGSRNKVLYRNKWKWGKARDYHRWWRARFPGVNNPLELSPWKDGSANAASVGVEVVPPEESVQAPWSGKAYESLSIVAEHLNYIVGKSIPWYTHSELDPEGRTTSTSRPWDIRENHYEGLLLDDVEDVTTKGVKVVVKGVK